MRKRAVFCGTGGVAVVLWVVREETNCLYVTDDKGLHEVNLNGYSRRILGMGRKSARAYDATLEDRSSRGWSTLPPY